MNTPQWTRLCLGQNSWPWLLVVGHRCGEGEDLVSATCERRGDDAAFVDAEGDRRLEDAVLLGEPPARLEQDREWDPVLGDLHAVVFTRATADHDQRERVGLLVVERCPLRRERVPGSALGATG